MQSQVPIKYVLLKDLVSFKMGTIIKNLTILKQANQLNGQYEIISSAIKPVGKWHQFNRDAKMITITKDGINAGFVDWQTDPFWATEHSLTLFNESKAILDSKYLYYYLKNLEWLIQDNKVNSAIPYIRIEYLKNLKIPLPDISIQKQIAATLDKFNQLTNQLTNQLNLRNKQYQYYLEHLMDFANDNHPLIKDGGG